MSVSFWTEERNEILRENYGRMLAKELAEMLGTTASSVFHQASRLGIHKIALKTKLKKWV